MEVCGLGIYLHLYHNLCHMDKTLVTYSKENILYSEPLCSIPHLFSTSRAQQPLVYESLVIIEASDTPHWVWLLWMSDLPDTETSTWQHTTLSWGSHPCFQWDSNPWLQPAWRERRWAAMWTFGACVPLCCLFTCPQLPRNLLMQLLGGWKRQQWSKIMTT
jgi:hypothetical protein